MSDSTGDITHLLPRGREGDRQAENWLGAVVFPSLRRMANYLMRGERKRHSLQPTELVNQVYFRLIAARDWDWQNRCHFYAMAAGGMRRYLIDYARGRPRAEFVGFEEMKDLPPADSTKLDLAITIVDREDGEILLFHDGPRGSSIPMAI